MPLPNAASIRGMRSASWPNRHGNSGEYRASVASVGRLAAASPMRLSPLASRKPRRSSDALVTEPKRARKPSRSSTIVRLVTVRSASASRRAGAESERCSEKPATSVMSALRSGSAGFTPSTSAFNPTSVCPSWVPRPCRPCESAPRVVARSWGRTACRSGRRSSSTRSTSCADRLRSSPITAPAAMRRGPGTAGGTSDTYFCPKSVLGRRRAVTSAGIWSTSFGSSESSTVAPSPSVLIAVTLPTTRPRTLTSAFGSSWVPTRSTLSVTGTPARNAPAYCATASPASSTSTPRKASPRTAFIPPPARTCPSRRSRA